MPDDLLRQKRALEVLDLCHPRGLTASMLHAEANLTDRVFDSVDQVEAALLDFERLGLVVRHVRSRLTPDVYVWMITGEGQRTLEEANA